MVLVINYNSLLLYFNLAFDFPVAEIEIENYIVTFIKDKTKKNIPTFIFTI